MKTCNIKTLHFYNQVTDNKTVVKVVDYLDGHWTITLGDYGFDATIVATDKDIGELCSALFEMFYDCTERQQEEAAESGDFENTPKEDERNTEAWLDAPGKEQMSYGGTE